MYTNHINAGSGCTGVGNTQIQCRESDGASQLLPMNHVAANTKGGTQQSLGAFQIAYCQRGTDITAGNTALMAVSDISNGLDSKAVACPGLAQQIDIASSFIAKAEILTVQQPAGV